MSRDIGDATQFVVPPSIVSKLDLAHLVTEVEQRDSDMVDAAARAKSGVASQPLPRGSAGLEDFLELNQFSMEKGVDRGELIRQLRRLKEDVPVIHMTFASEPDHKSLQQIAAWLRSSVHAQAVIEAGIQPGLVAGVYVRTPNQVYDLSLRRAIQDGRGILTQQLGALYGTV